MEFQIHDEAGNPILINDLDKEAREFWKLPDTIKDTRWAYPNFNNKLSEIEDAKQAIISNWYEVIGKVIASNRYCENWKDVKAFIYKQYIGYSFVELSIVQKYDYIKAIDDIVKPYYELIDYWEAKKYKPKHIKQ
jgi:hypothetical protein